MSAGPSELYLDAIPGERRAALVGADGRLESLRIDRDGRPRVAEAIFRARVVRIDKQTGAAFLDLGPAGEAMLPKAGGLTEGAAVTVQATREAFGGKGAGVTRGWSLSERYLAWTAGRKGIQWSPALGQGKRRSELEQALERAFAAAPDAAGLRDGLSVRAQALAADGAALAGDLARLARRRAAILAAEAAARPPATLEPAPDFAQAAVRDAPAHARIATDDRALHQRLKGLAGEAWPDLAEGLAFSDPARGALFEEAGLADSIEDALARRVPLSGGGRITIDRTEAMVVIDIDSGGSADGGGKKEEALFRLNKRALEEAARQIRLRNLSGLIVIDCVTLRGKGRMKALVESLRARVKSDPVKTDVLGFTAAGLIEATRQRFGPSLDELMNAPAGAPAPAPDAQATAILRAALRLRGAGRPTAQASEAVERAFAGPLAAAKAEVDRRLGRSLEVRRGEDRTPPIVEMER